MRVPIFRQGKPLLSSRVSNILGLIVSILFVLSALIVHRELSALEFWGAILLFGGCGYMALRDLLNPEKAAISPEQRTAEFHQRRQMETGFFKYLPDGFTYGAAPENPFYRWTDIQSVFAYQTTYWDDRYTVTEITLDIFLSGNQRIQMMQSSPGWFQINKRLSEALNGFPGNWEQHFDVHGSYPNKRLLFDRQGRTLTEAEKDYFQNETH